MLDLRSESIISLSSQIFPLFMMKVFGGIPGIPGLIISALYAATLRYDEVGEKHRKPPKS